MREIILISNENYGIKEFEYILKEKYPNQKIIIDSESITVEFKKADELFGDFIQIVEAPEIENSMDPEEIKLIHKQYNSPNYYFINFKDIDLLKSFIKNIADRSDVLIDNDHGLVLSGSEFIKRIELNPDWDWSRD